VIFEFLSYSATTTPVITRLVLVPAVKHRNHQTGTGQKNRLFSIFRTSNSSRPAYYKYTACSIAAAYRDAFSYHRCKAAALVIPRSRTLPDTHESFPASFLRLCPTVDCRQPRFGARCRRALQFPRSFGCVPHSNPLEIPASSRLQYTARTSPKFFSRTVGQLVRPPRRC
jgi:hypothetical protein